MGKRIFILRRTSNETVTSHNFDVIRDAAIQTGMEVFDYTSMTNCIKEGCKEDIYVVTTIDDAIRLFMRGRRKIFNWVQGIIPEESYMRHHSWVRFKVLSLEENLALRSCAYLAFVSKAMEDHYRQKYHLSFEGRSMFFPCYNTNIIEAAFKADRKYKDNTFVYAGGLAEWQCFDETLDIYKTIEDLNIDNTSLIVLTKDQNTAQKKIGERGIKNFSIDFVAKEDLPQVLSKAKFGFVIRKDCPVNNVSTPTKISSYLSCGLIPIFGSCIKSFKDQSKDMKYAIPWSFDQQSLDRIVEMMKTDIRNEDVLNEYKMVFERYFSDLKNIKEISSILSKLA